MGNTLMMTTGIQPLFATACILAGGQGRRMEGRDKLALSLGGERLLSMIARQLRPHFSDLIAVSSRVEAFEGLDYRVIPDSLQTGGPLAGLHAGLQSAKSQWVYLLACDMPFFSIPWLETLKARIVESEQASFPPPVALAASMGTYFEPFHAFYRTSFLKDIEEAIEKPASTITQPSQKVTIQTLARSRRVDLVLGIEHIIGPLPLFMNLNTPSDIALAEASLLLYPNA